MNGYFVGDTHFETCAKAIEYAHSIGAEVFLAENGVRGRRVWAPIPVSKKRLRYYRERVAAAEAYKRMKEGK